MYVNFIQDEIPILLTGIKVYHRNKSRFIKMCMISTQFSRNKTNGFNEHNENIHENNNVLQHVYTIGTKKL